MGYGGKGKGGGMPYWFRDMARMMMGKGNGKGRKRGLAAFASEKKVWIGNVPEGTTYQELQEHFGSCGTAKFAAVFSGKGQGSGGVAFAEEAEAQKALSLNGKPFKGAKLEVDVWTKMENAEKK